MAEEKKYLDKTGLTYLWSKITALFHPFTGAEIDKDGVQGEVPQPKKATQDYNKFLKGDGTWATPENTEYSEATQSAAGLMSATDKTNLDNAVSKLSGIANGAEVNQNAFSTVKVGTTSLSADTKTDTLTITAGDHITLTPTESSDSFSIAASFADATQTASGLMSSDDKTKLDGLSTSQVTGVKGNSETNYRTGQVNITAANIGLGNVDNTADANKSVQSAGTLTTARSIDGVSFNGSANIIHFGTCSTAAATKAKEVKSIAGFTLTSGARALIKFTYGNTYVGATLNIYKTSSSGTGAKNLLYHGSTTVPLVAGGVYEIVYDGTQYNIVGDIDTNTTYSVATASDNGLMSSSDYAFLHNTGTGTLSGTYATKSELSSAVSGLFKYKGSTATESGLPSNPAIGDVWNIESVSAYGGPGTNVVYTENGWDSLGSLFYIESLQNTEIDDACK